MKGWKEAARRWITGNVLLTAMALASGGLALSAADRYLEDRVRHIEARAEARFRHKSVVVANRDLPTGSILAADMLSTRAMPEDFLPGGAMVAEGVAPMLGRRLSIPMQRGDALTPALLAPVEPATLATALGEGQRALTVPVDETNSMAGLLVAGDRVDLYLSDAVGSSASRLALLLENLRVLATGSEMTSAAHSGSASHYGTVTMLVTAEEAAKIILAQHSGTLSVVLRAPTDVSSSHVNTRHTRDLLRSLHGVPPRRSGSTPIELLLGGGGGPVPQRRVLAPGTSTIASGEPS